MDFQNTTSLFVNITGLSLSMVKIGLAGIILAEAGLAWVYFWQQLPMRVFINLTMMLLFLFSVTSFLLYLMGVNNCGCFGTMITTQPLMTIGKNMALIVLILFFRKKIGHHDRDN
jgi:hypothetical protein